MATEDTQDVPSASSAEREVSRIKSDHNQPQAFRRRFDVAPVATPKAPDSRGDAPARTSADLPKEQERDGAEDAEVGEGNKENCQTAEDQKMPYIRKDSMHRGESFMNMSTRLSESLNQSFRGLDVSERLCSLGDSVAWLMQGEE